MHDKCIDVLYITVKLSLIYEMSGRRAYNPFLDVEAQVGDERDEEKDEEQDEEGDEEVHWLCKGVVKRTARASADYPMGQVLGVKSFEV